MLLAFDVGNTNIVCGIYRGKELLNHWRLATDTLQTADGYASVLGTLFRINGLQFSDIEDVIISTVVPPIIPILESLSRRYFSVNPILVGPGIKTGLNILYDNPKDLGADRIVNAVAAIAEYKCPLIVIDLGTATTFCVIDEKGIILAGLLLRGSVFHGSPFPTGVQTAAYRTVKTEFHYLSKYRVCHAGRDLLRLRGTD